MSGLAQKKSLVGIEIGVAGGEHAQSLLSTLDISTLYLIDPYELYESYIEGIKQYGTLQESLGQSEIFARELLDAFKEKIVWVKQLSNSAVNEIPSGLDFVYIDGNHEYAFVADDIATYLPKLKVGGIIGGHDFYNGFQRDHDGVVRAVTEFAVRNQLDLQVELPDWWVVKK